MNGILDYLEKSARQFPNKTAMAFADEIYSFSELLLLSRQLASAIDSEYTGRPIVVFCNRNAHVAIFFLATIYSGNFYVPIDPDAPVEKIQTILNDAAPKYIFGDEQNQLILDNLEFSGEFVTLEEKKNVLRSTPKIDENDPLYMVYTSGSTGKPKGVLKSHKAVISFVEAYCQTFEFLSDDIIGNQTPFFFDASAKDFYLALKIGATLEIIPTEKFAMPPELIDYINSKHITFISWVPTALSIVAKLRTFSYVKPKSLKKVFFVGEVMPIKHLNYWRQHLPDLQYVNLYGQSEIAGINCYYNVSENFENDVVLPMGKPLCNSKVYLIGENGIITQPNTIGEIYVVSDALALEYYRDKEKTDEVFRNMDFGEGRVRAFKSGDLASYDCYGNLIFASRADFQIKHMGHRIELGEIEVVCGALPYVQSCCCLYNSEKSRITLFCELIPGSDKSGKEIQSELRPKLSSYMLPGKVIIMDVLPQNANGKIDRQKLKEFL